MRNIIILLFTIVFFVCCSKEKRQLEFHRQEKGEYTIIPYSELLGITMQITKKDSLLLINDFFGDSLIQIFNLNNNQLIRKLISTGNGPNELISPLEIHIENNDLFVFCRQTYIQYSAPFDSLLLNGGKELNKDFEASSKVNHLYPLTDSLFIASGFFEKRYALIDNKGKEIVEFGEYPAFWNKEKQLSSQIKAMFHQTEFIKNPIKPFFISYSSHILEIFDFSTIGNPTLIKNIVMGNYEYSYVDDGSVLSTNRNYDTEKGITTASCTADYIYVVYNFQKENEKDTKTQIQIINWNGEPIKALNFEKNITCLFIDEKENRGYIIIQDPDDTLAYFNL